MEPHDVGARYRVVLGLGSNLGDRLVNLRRAVDLLEDVLVVESRSSVYESPPVGPPQPDYLNAAVCGVTTLEPAELLRATLAIERTLGRTRPDEVRWGPRTIDIDILWSERGAYRDDALEIPHPRLHERAFALQPLVELVPDAADASGSRYATLAGAPLRRVAAL